MVDVPVRQQDVPDREPLAPHDLEQGLDLVTRVDQHGLAARPATQHEAVLVEGGDGSDLQQHSGLPLLPR